METENARPPISAELWSRLRKLDPHTAISFNRTFPAPKSPWLGYPKVWVVTLRPDELYETVQTAHPRLEEALREALEQAEKRGWDRLRTKSKAPAPSSASPGVGLAATDSQRRTPLGSR